MADTARSAPPTQAAPTRRTRIATHLSSWAGAYAAPVLTLVAALTVWQLVTSAWHIPVVILPSPTVIVQGIVHDRGVLAANTVPTVEEALFGFLLSVLVGIPLGLFMARSKLFSNSVLPFIIGSQSTPKIAIAPLLVLWLGFGILPKLLVSFLDAFFPIVINTVSGMSGIPEEMRDLGRILRLDGGALFRRIEFPYALPQIFAGVKVAMPLALVGAIGAEFVGANHGLGFLLIAANGNFNTPLLFGALIVLTCVGVVLYSLVQLLEGILLPWHVSKRARG